jgi:FkbH-like protein
MYRLAVEGKPLDTEKMLLEVAEFAGALRRISPRVEHVFVPTWIPIQPCEDRRGALDMDREYGLAAALMRMNLRLQEELQLDKRARVFNAVRWIAKIGEGAYSAKLRYFSKTPFSVDLFREAATDFAAAMRGFAGRSRKLLILDLDNTLWDGVVGESGWHALKLGGHDPTGEALRDFQLALRSLRRRGVLLGVVSKNEEAAALEAIREHPEMVLRLDDFAGWKINWNDKAQNVIDLIADLNLGRDAAVFIDDDPAERARVREAVPELLVPEWPNNPLQFAAALRRLDCFDLPVISVEDRERTSTYVGNRHREQVQQNAPSMEEWLRTMQLRLEIEALTPANLDRTVQLLNKTNQMNLRTRRMSAGELTGWSNRPGHYLATFRLTDRFGDYGLVGIGSVAVEIDARVAAIEDFVLSCRAMGRRVEEAMLYALAAISWHAGAAELTAQFIETPRNKPCLKFFESCCMQRDENANWLSYRLELKSLPAFPDCITLVGLERLAPNAADKICVIASSNREPRTGRINAENEAR